MRLGIGTANLTPPLGTPLAGFGFRDHGAESVRDDLEARVLWFADGEGPENAACIVTADIIGFDESLTSSLRQETARRYGLPSERLLLAASHTHSGPATCANMVAVGELVPETVAMIRERLLAAIAEAQAALKPISLHAGKGVCSGYAVNRRVLTPSGVVSAPNPDGVRDDEVSVVACRDLADGSVPAVLFHFTCHSTLMGDYAIGGDYPGAARRYAEKALGGEAVAAFLPGCFGDVRPNCAFLGGQRFRRGQEEDLAAFGEALGGEVARIAREATRPVQPRLFGRNATRMLRLARHPERAELETLAAFGKSVECAWAAHLLAAPFSDTRPLTFQRLDLAEDVTLLAMGGEICCDFGLAIKRKRPDGFLLPLGYSNGLIGYICPRRLFQEGGYEPDTSTPYHGLPSAFVPDIEEEIYEAVDALLSDSTL